MDNEPAPTTTRAVVLLYPGCTIAEVIEVATRLTGAGVQVVFVSPDSSPVIDASGLHMQPAMALADVDPNTVDAVIVPGGDPAAIIEDADVISWLRGVSTATLAGICAGVAVMAASGLTEGRHITHNYRAPWAPPEVVEFVGHLWSGATVEADLSVGVVQDGTLITALPNATIEFTVTILRSLDLISDADTAQMTQHLRGDHVPELFTKP